MNNQSVKRGGSDRTFRQERPYKWDVLAKIEIGTNRELWLEKRWQTPSPEEIPHFIFVSVTYAVTDLGKKPNYQDVPETIVFNLEALANINEALGLVLERLGFFETETDGVK